MAKKIYLAKLLIIVFDVADKRFSNLCIVDQWQKYCLKYLILSSWYFARTSKKWNSFDDMQCTMLVKKLTRRSMRILTPSLQKSTALLTSIEERMLMLLVTNWWRHEGEMSMSEGLVRALPKASQYWVWLGPRPPVWRSTSARPAYPIHHWYGKEGYLSDEGGQSTGSIRHSGEDDMSSRWSVISQLQSFTMARYLLTGSRVSLSASARVREMHWKGETTTVSSWQSRSWKFWRQLWTASSDSWCQLTISSLASS